MPVAFVLVWSTGFVVARFGMPHAPPLTLLAIRFALSCVAFAIWVGVTRPSWPQDRSQWFHLAMVGALTHAIYLGGVWAAVKAGMGAGTIALMAGLQPVLTAVWVSATGSEHRVSGRQWAGLLLGLIGLCLVLWRKLGMGELNLFNISLGVLALLAITTGTLYQKRFVAPCDVRTAVLIQLGAALLLTLPFALLESEPVVWHPELIGALVWSVLMLTLLGSSMLYMMVQRGAATQVTSLLYLVPPCAALQAWLLFGEAMGALVWLGMAITAIGVGLVVGRPAS
jgi:drug/metabolite transporter (DMT)-like permease